MMRVDAEKDFHGFQASEMLDWLEDTWARRRWHGARRVRIIHGRGVVLPAALHRWCDEKGISYAVEPRNPGATLLHPALRALPNATHRHYPLAKYRPHFAGRRAPDSDQKAAPAAQAESEPQDDLLAREFEQLSKSDPRDLLRRKRQ